ncbi:MAG: hypothetical protein MI923_10160 [Phycisphaerales bacterium]|nr:hypothetical protein [Phycisphaerales bacterium]
MSAKVATLNRMKLIRPESDVPAGFESVELSDDIPSLMQLEVLTHRPTAFRRINDRTPSLDLN